MTLNEQRQEELLNEANSYFDEMRYGEALSRYQELADAGHAHARSMVGWIHHHGLGVPVDYEEATKCYLLAEREGSQLAQFQLGNLCMAKGDFQAGMDWYEKAASRGYMPALFRLACQFETGNPVTPVDKEKANQLLQQAAASGHLHSLVRIAHKQIRGEFGFWQRLGGFVLMIKIYVQAIGVGWKDPHSESFGK